MPRISKRARVIRDLESIVSDRIEARQLRVFLGKDEPQEDAVDLAACIALQNAERQRYMFRSGRYRQGPSETLFTMNIVTEAAERGGG
jgi:hypothetical protein